MSTIGEIKLNILTSLDECHVLFNYCISTRGPHAAPGVESAFLQAFQSWEVFLEEALLCYLCGEQPLNGTITPYFTVNDSEVARKILYQDRPFCQWTRIHDVIERFSYFFPLPNRIEDSLRPIVAELGEMAKVRNVIAHTSLVANKRFNDMCRSKIGGTRNITRAYDFLILHDSNNPGSVYFDTYTSILGITATNITG